MLPGAPKTKRVVLVVFGGGVRSRETIESDNVPNLMRIAEEGIVFPNTAVENVGHYGAALSVMTGQFERLGIRENQRGVNPTLFEVVRRETGLGAEDVWLATSGETQDVNYSYSSNPRYGAKYGANLLGGEGLFNVEFREMLGANALGRADPEQEQLLTQLKSAIRTPTPVAESEGLSNDVETSARIEQYLLDELRGNVAELTGTGARDAKALRVARNLLSIFRPRLLTVSLRDADIAHGDFNGYVEVIRRNDREIGELFDAVRADPELADSTAILVLPEFGRDRDLNERRGLDHGDSSRELLRVALVAWGPDFKSGKVDRREIASIDVVPTILSLFGVRPPSTVRGSAIKSLLA